MIRKIVIGSAILVVIIGIALAGLSIARRIPIEPGELLDRHAFRCYGVSESMRTIGFTRQQRKEKQLKRVNRLLQHELQPLDEAKIRTERAILTWDIEDTIFQMGCAEAYYMPGSTKLRESYKKPPAAFDASPVEEAFLKAFEKVPPRLFLHGFEERGSLHLAEAALLQKKWDRAARLAGEHLEKFPSGLYSDTIKNVKADALLAQGKSLDALALYKEVGRLPIGIDAHYARYRAGMLQQKLGESEEAQKLLQDVIRWSRRGDRNALLRVLENREPVPPLVQPYRP